MGGSETREARAERHTRSCPAYGDLVASSNFPADHRARARAVRPRLVRAASDTRLLANSVCGEDAVTLVEAGALARAAELAESAGAPPAGLSGDAALGWRAAREAIVAALVLAADHQGGRVSADPPRPPRPRRRTPYVPSWPTIDWSESGTPTPRQ